MDNFKSYPVTSDASADETNPTTSTILADSGAMPSAVYAVTVLVGASAAAKFLVQVRNAANDANIGDAHIIYCAAGAGLAVPFTFALNKNERVRVTMHTNLTGTGAASVQLQRCG
jgi:hypothetical protein